MIADIFYPILILHCFSIFYMKKKIVQGLCTHVFTRASPWPPWGLTAPPRPPAVIVFGFAKNWCIHFFSVLSPDPSSFNGFNRFFGYLVWSTGNIPENMGKKILLNRLRMKKKKYQKYQKLFIGTHTYRKQVFFLCC